MIFQPISSGSSGNLYLVSDTKPGEIRLSTLDEPVKSGDHINISRGARPGPPGARQLAIECGLPFAEMRKKLNYRVTGLDGVLISHCHADHARALKKVLQAGVDVYALAHTFEEAELEQTAVSLPSADHHNAHAVEPLVPFVIKDHWHVMPFDLRHDVPAIGFIVQSNLEKLVYITDTSFVPYKFAGLTTIAIEANYSEGFLRESTEGMYRKMRSLHYHMSIERVLLFLSENDLSSVREIHLLHLSDAHSDERMFKSVVEAYTGKPVYIAKR